MFQEQCVFNIGNIRLLW